MNNEEYTPLKKFQYWIRERDTIRHLRESGAAKPWSDNPTFRTTYFCNVRREDDKVTKWIRENWSPFKIGSVNYEFAMVVARFLNWPPTLQYITDPLILARPGPEQPDWAKNDYFPALKNWLEQLALEGKVWGNAYVITSHGMPMSKVSYLTDHLLPDVLRALPAVQYACGRAYGEPNEAIAASKLATLTHPTGTCAAACEALQCVQGIGSFLAGQVVADLKNTVGHPLYTAPDKKSFVVPGPGSIRGLNWLHSGSESGFVTERNFHAYFHLAKELALEVMDLDNQDIQNCLCEFDKYMRVSTGKGRSKRIFKGE
jgi:hypothetical protein